MYLSKMVNSVIDALKLSGWNLNLINFKYVHILRPKTYISQIFQIMQYIGLLQIKIVQFMEFCMNSHTNHS